MKEAIREKALSLGFDDCRFTTAAPPPSRDHFLHWLENSHHGTMGYLQRNAHKRIDPQQVLTSARSIVTLASSYHLPSARSLQSSQPVSGIIARYARHADYHDILSEPLKTLTQELNRLGGPETRSLWYVDTGPFLERDLAQRAGLGFIGKHTNLIHRRLGNWLFIAEIISTIALPPDPPETNHCGKCTRCITACPTHAIAAPFVLDARKCISYLTIELKGSIPEAYRPALGSRIYGCDDCLEVCPWNRFAREGRLMKKAHRGDLDTPDLLELLALDGQAFKRRFAGTPMLRTKRRGLLRNVCVALGNVGDEHCLPALEKAARDHEPLIVEHAQWAIEQIQARIRTSASSQK